MYIEIKTFEDFKTYIREAKDVDAKGLILLHLVDARGSNILDFDEESDMFNRQKKFTLLFQSDIGAVFWSGLLKPETTRDEIYREIGILESYYKVVQAKRLSMKSDVRAGNLSLY
ncbi:hypothetical protein ATL39_1246 [Sinobaca qinghaiensis]|uniref:Uncharacterized protein n=1 Tax=Sinobaca qinghaiensis TaxID=342944 RepID=A0A419V6L2_9BACL|nr:hypothetical protein [Sinobaca qinghaiensis]RKD75546.1 hypothetical protein ATL39_1246 [Sinobaca qinghaiensis]